MSRSRQRWMLVAMVTVLSLTPSLWAANILWAPAGGGSWGDTTKWTGGILPLDTDAVTFQTNIAAGDATVTLDGNRTVTANPTYAITFQYAQTTKWWIIASGTGGNGEGRRGGDR